MGTIAVRCTCGRHLKVPDSILGHSGKCPFCGCRLRLVAPKFSPGGDRFTHGLIIEAGLTRVGEQILIAGAGPIEIGKLRGKSICLPGQKISRSHCRLIHTGEGWRVWDQDSSNGLYVNEKRVTSHDLRDGDTLGIGEYTLRFIAVGDDAAIQPAQAPLPSAPVTQDEDEELFLPLPDDEPFEDQQPTEDDLYKLSEEELLEEEDETPLEPIEIEVVDTAPAPPCPSCGKAQPPGAHICLDCGIKLHTGKAILTVDDSGIEDTYRRARSIAWWVSWLSPIGIYPIASEAFGIRKPWVIRGIAILTILVSVWVWKHEWSGDTMRIKNLMLWTGHQALPAEMLTELYQFLPYGDYKAFKAKRKELAGGKPLTALTPEQFAEITVRAHQSLPPEQQCVGQFHWYEFITHIFLHGGLFHLFGNLLFLMILGSRVNSLIGNVAAGPIYLLLGVLAGLAHLIASSGNYPMPMVGASGAIMGLSGMYLVLMPVHRMHMVFWIGWGYLRIPRISDRLFALRGFWVVLFYIAFDVFYIATAREDQVAHWAHLGGFIAGIVVGLVLLLGRLVNCRGGDLLTAILGRRAWALIGKPDPNRRSLIAWI